LEKNSDTLNDDYIEMKKKC